MQTTKTTKPISIFYDLFLSFYVINLDFVISTGRRHSCAREVACEEDGAISEAATLPVHRHCARRPPVGRAAANGHDWPVPSAVDGPDRQNCAGAGYQFGCSYSSTISCNTLLTNNI